jgi:hypothetical protein
MMYENNGSERAANEEREVRNVVVALSAIPRFFFPKPVTGWYPQP